MSENPWKGLVAGTVAGFAGTIIMTKFQNVWNSLTQDDSDSESEEDPSTVKAAESVSEAVFDHELTKDEKKVAGPAVHYGMGTSAGAAYGTLAELFPKITLGGGLPFGAAFWLAADEAAVPAVGLSEPPWKQPASVHLYGLAAHLVYGFATEVVRRGVRRLL